MNSKRNNRRYINFRSPKEYFIFSETLYKFNHLNSLILSLLTVVSKVHFMATAIADFVRMGCVQLQAQIGNKFTSQWPATF